MLSMEFKFISKHKGYFHTDLHVPLYFENTLAKNMIHQYFNTNIFFPVLQPNLTLKGKSFDFPDRVEGGKVDKFSDDLLIFDGKIAAGYADLRSNSNILVIKALQECWQEFGRHYSCECNRQITWYDIII